MTIDDLLPEDDEAERVEAAFDQATVVLTLLRRLEETLVLERSIVRAMQMERLQGLQGEKEALAEAYERAVRAMRQEPERLAALPEDTRVELREATRRFQKALNDNADQLAAARAIVEKVVRILGDSAQTQASLKGRYAPRQTGSTASAEIIPIAVNRQI